jgi:hypothetical protein
MLRAWRRRAPGSCHPFLLFGFADSQPASAGFVGVAGSLQGPAGARDML